MCINAVMNEATKNRPTCSWLGVGGVFNMTRFGAGCASDVIIVIDNGVIVVENEVIVIEDVAPGLGLSLPLA